MAEPRFSCEICGKHQAAERMIYSRPTGFHYCRDAKACAKRAARKRVAT